jgi:hypothetical protein
LGRLGEMLVRKVDIRASRLAATAIGWLPLQSQL